MADARATLVPGVGHVPLPASAIEQTLAAAIEDRIVTSPDTIAVRMDDERWTYAQLGRATDRVAHDLGTADVLGHHRGDGLPPVIAVVARQSIELIIAIVGVLKAGATYLPIDPTHPPARSGELLDAVDAAALVTDPGSAALARRLAARRPVVTATVDGPTVDRPARVDDPSAAAYMYSTSGSTGRPKIVVDRHRNVLHNVRRYANSLAIGPGDRLSLVQSSTFSGAVSSLFGALVNGSTCVLFDLRRDGAAALGAWARDSRLTMFHAVPVLFRALCTPGATYPDVRVVRLEGDVAAWSDVELFRRHFREGAVLVNGLGATETGLVRQFFADHGTTPGHGSLPLGYPVPDMDVQLVDETGDPVAPGQTGEIVVRSAYLALGYHGDEERSRRSFPPADGVERRYRTGDLGRFEPDGRLVGLGRRDFTDKIRGETIDLAEIEVHLRSQPGIRDAVAVTRREGRDGAARLVAYVVTDVGPEPTIDRLRRSLGTVLPRAWVPSAIVTLPSLPLDASSKVDRARLPAPDTARPRLSTAYMAPRTPLEVELVGIWEDVLGVRGIGVLDDFFDLGGDSLDAARLTVALGERSGAAAADDAVAKASTVEGLARRLAGPPPDTTAPILFAVPGDRFNSEFFVRPSRALDGRLSMRSLAPTVACADPLDIAADAALLSAQIRSIQPAGPYHLVGFCFGAVTALEIAQLLRDDGHAVATVVLLGISPLEFPTLVDRTTTPGIVRRAGHWASAGLAGLREAGDLAARARYFIRNVDRIARSAIRATRHGLAGHGLGSAPQQTDLDRRLAAIDARPARRFEGRVVVILGARSAAAYTRHAHRAWSGLAREVDVVLLPGRDHDMLVDPRARDLAATLLAAAEGRRPG